ncbi:MAG: ABC-type amino acid transport/signal transduction system, periplasmic component/domain [Bacillota bacterium]|jgi:polar amino acid transport system substrate-binding protein|nr:ABC-type amino acid transport/signal transduction system, periplasmic component/domain [Bacillota bacterium]
MSKKIYKLVSVLMLSAAILGVLSGCASNKETVSEEANRLEAIKERGYIEVATEPYFAPYEFIDPSKQGTEQYVGSDIELAKYIAEKLGVELRIVPLEFAAVLSSITEGKYDLAISALAYTPARAEAMNMSKGYNFTDEGIGYGLLIRKADEVNIKSPADIKDKIIVAQSGSLQELFVNEQVPAYKEFKRVSATTDGLLMVQESKADVCAVSIDMAQLYIDANPDAGLMIVKDFNFTVDESTQGTRIGIQKGEDELTDEINKIIDEVVSNGQFKKWHAEYTEYSKSLGL